MPGKWELKYNLDQEHKNNNSGKDGDGFTNIEEWLKVQHRKILNIQLNQLLFRYFLIFQLMLHLFHLK